MPVLVLNITESWEIPENSYLKAKKQWALKVRSDDSPQEHCRLLKLNHFTCNLEVSIPSVDDSTASSEFKLDGEASFFEMLVVE
jgi:hypothetical protein